MKEKICLITGANSGIGKESAIALAKMGATIIMACRNPVKADLAKAEIIQESGNQNVEVMLVDFSSQKGIRVFATEFKSKFHKLDVLLNNAGVIADSRELTEDGIEKTFAVNHLGYFLLTNLLLEQLHSAKSARIVNVSSEGHRIGNINFNNLNLEKGYSNMKAYTNSKLANILFTAEMANRLQDSNITVNCLHPGVVNSNFGGASSVFWQAMILLAKPFMISSKKGAETSIFLASSLKVAGISGKYFSSKKEKKPSFQARNQDIAKQLWEVSEKLTGMA